jgi:hypothetical protein
MYGLRREKKKKPWLFFLRSRESIEAEIIVWEQKNLGHFCQVTNSFNPASQLAIDTGKSARFLRIPGPIQRECDFYTAARPIPTFTTQSLNFFFVCVCVEKNTE